ncbi:hypothetical protein HDU79_006070 [Rhizoclosmatium sp. JEL0117]|nr:hypothetical protein HDU79_006070 [Rhizoclosmatium sp. JEL0117]
MQSKAEKAAKYQTLLRAASTGSARLAASKAKGRHVKAAADLVSGTNVVVETASALALLKHSTDELCLCCLRPLPSESTTRAGERINLLGGSSSSKTSAIKCARCIKQAFYCSDTCKDNDAKRHALECEVLRDLPGITAAANVDYTLMRLVLAVLVQRSMELSGAAAARENTSTDLVFDLLSHRKTCDPKWLACVEECVEDFTQHLPPELAIPVSDIVSLACRINSNSHGIIDPTGNTNGEVGVGMFPLVAMLNHSCAPNCSFVSSTHGKMIVRTLRPVKEGEELCVSYVDLCTPRDERRGKLLETKHFWCACSRCEPSDSSDSSNTDSHLDALLCTSCNSHESFHSPTNDYTCQTCSLQISKDQHTHLTHEAESSYSNAHDLFKARHNDSAITAFNQFLEKYSTVLHPGHSLLLNTYATMTSAFMRLHKFPSVVKYGRLAINSMSQYVPPNWPELADFWFRQAEVLEILGRAVGEGVVTIDEASVAFEEPFVSSDKDEISLFILEEALKAYKTCWGMRSIAYGDDHTRTVEAAEQVDRLERDVVRD